MQRILTNKREAILNGTAPAWENDISCYPERIPQIFAEDFRRVRNIVNAHVKLPPRIHGDLCRKIHASGRANRTSDSFQNFLGLFRSNDCLWLLDINGRCWNTSANRSWRTGDKPESQKYPNPCIDYVWSFLGW